MVCRIRIDPAAQSEIDRFAEYLGEYDEEFAIEQSPDAEPVAKGFRPAINASIIAHSTASGEARRADIAQDVGAQTVVALVIMP